MSSRAFEMSTSRRMLSAQNFTSTASNQARIEDLLPALVTHHTETFAIHCIIYTTTTILSVVSLTNFRAFPSSTSHILTKNPIQNKSLFLIHFKRTGSSDLSFCKTAKNKTYNNDETAYVHRSLCDAQPHIFCLVFGFSFRVVLCGLCTKKRARHLFHTTQRYNFISKRLCPQR